MEKKGTGAWNSQKYWGPKGWCLGTVLNINVFSLQVVAVYMGGVQESRGDQVGNRGYRDKDCLNPATIIYHYMYRSLSPMQLLSPKRVNGKVY